MVSAVIPICYGLTNPLPSCIPSPELGAGPIPGVVGRLSPLPSGTPSPELGAGPTLLAAITVPQKRLATTRNAITIPTIFFILIPQ